MTAKVKILVMEHEIPVAMMMVARLTQAGCDAKAVCSGKKGIELATTRKFDLIILDIDLPDVDSLEVCYDLKQRHISKHTPIVLISGQSTENVRQHSLEFGATDYITKPLNAADFVLRILSNIKTERNSDVANSLP